MRYKVLIILIVFIFSSCEKIVRKDIDSYDLVPKNSKAVISINNLGKFKNSLENNSYLNSVSSSNMILKNLVTQLSKIDNDKEVLVGLYDSNGMLNYNIIGLEISNDSITDNKFKYEKFDIISNNPLANPKININYFASKFQKINLINTNFSVALDSANTSTFMNKIFGNEFENSDGNLFLNIDASNKLISINGVVDNYRVINQNKDKKISIQEIPSPKRDVYFKFKNDLIEDYDLISTNHEKKFNFFNFENSDSLSENYKIFQLKKGDEIINVNGLISDYKKKVLDSLIDLKFETSISNEIILGPLIVKNHINNSNEIVVQDSQNILYLINNLGQVEWTKKIDGKIIKEINQIDSYKNGKLQLAFVTKKSLYMLDRKGRDVGKFPLKFNDAITKPLSVFDYDSNKNYRLLITQNNELYMFDSKGNIIRGFNYDKKGRIITKPKHFRISNKDIIVFKTNDELTILNRRGRVRIKTKRKHNFSENEIFQYQNFLVSTTDLNEVIKIDMQGNTFLEKPIANSIKLASEKKSIFTLERNILSNTKNNIEIAFGKYEDFKIYLRNDKSFINIFDSQNNKIYLFDNELNLIQGFPIKSKNNADFIFEKNAIEFSIKTNSKNIKYQTIK
tara:strand:- start:13472 stop:15340 length:1869 start_codon:yes stop_codon:yes gene_type:complete